MEKYGNGVGTISPLQMLNKKGKNEEVLIGISKELQGEEGSLGLFMVIGSLKKRTGIFYMRWPFWHTFSKKIL